jgi:hypothetical protein
MASKKVVRARVELDYEEGNLRCNYYPNLFEDPTLLEINGEEYPATMNITHKYSSIIIKIDVCKNEK